MNKRTHTSGCKTVIKHVGLKPMPQSNNHKRVEASIFDSYLHAEHRETMAAISTLRYFISNGAETK